MTRGERRLTIWHPNATTSVKSHISIHGSEDFQEFVGCSSQSKWANCMNLIRPNLQETVMTATVERRRWSRIRIRKESDLQTNRTINCVYWYLEFTLEKPPWVENHKTLNEIYHICLEARFQKFLYHARTRANSPAMILQVNSSLSFLFLSLIWEYQQRFTHKDSPAIIYFMCVWFHLQLPSTTDETKS